MAGEPILIVDDNAMNLKLTALVLSREGFRVETASSAEEAIRTLREFDPHLILMDIQMPGLDGLELTRKLKQDPESRHILVVALTAYTEDSNRTQALEAGCDDYLSKPVDTRRLPDFIRTHLESAALESA